MLLHCITYCITLLCRTVLYNTQIHIVVSYRAISLSSHLTTTITPRFISPCNNHLQQWFLTDVLRNYESRIFVFIIIMILEEFCNIFNNIFSKIYLFLRAMFLFVFWIVNFGVPQIFHTIKSIP